MLDLSPAASGVLLILLGLVFALLTLLLVRLIPRLPATPDRIQLQIPATIDAQDEAVMVVRSGGRVIYINPAARELFGCWEPQIDLESLVHRARPGDVFLALCAGEGRSRFTINGRFIDGSSYLLPGSLSGDGLGPAVLVSLRRPDLIFQEPVAGDPDGPSRARQPLEAGAAGRTFGIFTELTRAMASSLDLQVTIQTVLESIDRLFPTDLLEISLWDAETDRLTPYRLVGSPIAGRRLGKLPEYARTDDDFAIRLFTDRDLLLIQNPTAQPQLRARGDRQSFPYQTYLGIPLLIAGNPLGILELASLNKNSFAPDDLEVIRLLVGQAAVALNNALLHRKEQQRSVEIGGLAELARTIRSLSDPQDLYKRLIESISPLLAVEVLGFLIYDENRSILEGQEPFLGLPGPALQWCRVMIEPDSPAEAVWRSGGPIITDNAPEDPRIRAYELHHLAQAAGIRHTVMIPLESSGRMLGYLQAAKKRDGSAFDSSDQRILSIIAGQASPLIDNAGLMQQSRRRAQRAETLRRIASLTSSAATLEEILKFSVQDLARLYQADAAALFLLDHSRGELRLHRPSAFGIDPDSAARLGWVAADDPQFQLLAAGRRQPFLSRDIGEELHPAPFYLTLANILELRSAASAPLIIGDHTLGELFIASRKPDFFAAGDSQSLAAAAGQLAVAIDRSTLSSQTDQDLRRRVDQLVALTRISRELSARQNLDDLLNRVYSEALLATRADSGAIVLFHPANGEADGLPAIQISVGDPPSDRFHPLDFRAWQSGETVIGDELSSGESAGSIDPPPGLPAALPAAGESGDQLPEPGHPGVCSAMVNPILYRDRVAGVIRLHSKDPAHFTGFEREIGEALAIQVAVALGNAEREQDRRQRSEEVSRRAVAINKILDVFHTIHAGGSLEDILNTIAQVIRATTPYETIAVSVFNPEADTFDRLAGVGAPHSPRNFPGERPLSREELLAALQPADPNGSIISLPASPAVTPPNNGDSGAVATSIETKLSPDAGPALAVKLLGGSTGDLLGFITLDSPNPAAALDRIDLETLEVISGQAAMAIETHIKASSLGSDLDRIQRELELAQRTAEQAAAHLPALLHKDLEQTLAIRQLSRRAQRIRAGLEITEIVNRQTTGTEVLRTLAHELLVRMDFDLVLLAENIAGEPSLRLELGAIPADSRPQALLGQRNPLRHTLQTGELLQVASLNDHPGWMNTPLLSALEARSFVCMPIYGPDPTYSAKRTIAESGSGHAPERRPSAALLAVHHSPQVEYSAEDQRLFDLLTRQASTALQNLALQEDTSRRLNEVHILLDFSRRLGSLDPVQILQTLIESAMRLVPAAQMAAAVLWDAHAAVLVPQAVSGYADESEFRCIRYRPDEGIPGIVYSSGQAVNLEVVDFTRHYNLSPGNLLAYRNATAGRLPVACLAVPIQTGAAAEQDGSIQVGRRSPLGVLVLDSTQETAAFSENDREVVASLAQQTALSLENARLYQESRRQSSRLQALTSAAASVSSILKSEELSGALLTQLRKILPFDTGTLWLRLKEDLGDERGSQFRPHSERMVIRGALGFPDHDQRLGLTVDIDDSRLLNEMTVTGKPILVPDVRRDERFTTPALAGLNEDGEGLGVFEYLSWLGLPLIASGKVIGVIALEKRESEAYSTDEVQLASTFVGQAAAALENSELYEESVRRAFELDRRTKILSLLNRLSSELSGSLDADRILGFAVREFMAILQCSAASALRADASDEDISGPVILEAEYPEFPDSEYKPGVVLPNAPLLERLAQSLGIFHTDNALNEPELFELAAYLRQRGTCSLLIVPIVSAAGSSSDERKLHGFLLAHETSAIRFSDESVELARTISNQVAIALQNARLLQETLDLTEDLEQRIQLRTAELAHERQRAETLLTIIRELSASLDLDQVLHRTLQVLSEFVDAPQITILIARPGERKLQRLASIGYTSPPALHGSPTPFDIDQGLAGWVITQRQSTLVKDVLADPRWIPVDYPIDPKRPNYQHRSAMGVPLMSGAESLGCLMLYHPTVDHFNADQLSLVQAAANQVAVAINNAELYRLIRDQAEDLGNMLRNQQVETSRSKAILEAVADGVLVTDFNRVITLFNASAENILGLDRTQVVGKTMDTFSGLFGRATSQWINVVEAWTDDPTVYDPGDNFAEQFTLEDGRVIDVHLAPVIFRNDFLGTVSTFQDITHRVEVDRLKSEFVATVSHELRTPMTSIKGYVDILLMGAAGGLSEQQTEFLQVVKTNTERLSILVNDLLDISQIESGQLALNRIRVNLDDLASQALDELKRRNSGDTRGIRIEKDVEDGLPPVYGDPDRIRRILDNLLDNAFQYNLPGGRIRLRLRQVDGAVQVDISDSGVGIHPDDHERIFERFYRGDSTLTLGVSGTGLGLSIVRNLVQMHQGSIRVASSGIPGEGTTFSFTLPVYEPIPSDTFESG